MTIAVWFSQLQPGVPPKEYEEFVRSVDYPATERIPNILKYESIRLNGPAAGDESLDFQFIDLAEIADIESYREDLRSHEAVQEVHGQFERYVRSIGNFWAVPLGEGAVNTRE